MRLPMCVPMRVPDGVCPNRPTHPDAERVVRVGRKAAAVRRRPKLFAPNGIALPAQSKPWGAFPFRFAVVQGKIGHGST